MSYYKELLKNMLDYKKLLKLTNKFSVSEETFLANGLEWSGTFLEKMTWQRATALCKNLNYGGHDNWRLPTRVELIALYDSGEKSSDTAEKNYWSSTTYAYDLANAWYVNFYYGYVGNYYKSHKYYVRAVRNND